MAKFFFGVKKMIERLYRQLLDLKHAQSEAPTLKEREAITEEIKRLQARIDELDRIGK
jgi:uncharacterized protein YicC (UPF0701 family)